MTAWFWRREGRVLDRIARRPVAWAAGLVLGLTALRLLVLAISPLGLSPDEAQYWHWSLRLDWGYFSKPPLIAWIIAGSTALAGDDPFGIRLASPLLHAATAVGLGWAAWAVGAGWGGAALAAAMWITLPGVAFSAFLITTDVPLLLAWALALGAFARLLETGRPSWALATGCALGVGVLAKYAMLYALIGGALVLVTTPAARARLDRRHLVRVAAPLLLGLAPNLLWNLHNDWVTLGHTAANANLEGGAGQGVVHPGRALEFLAAQFGLAGPLVLGLWVVWVVRRHPWAGSVPERLLVHSALPLLLLVTVLALLSRAHANWAAPAFAAVVLALALAPPARPWLTAALGLNLVLSLALLVALAVPWQPPRFLDGFKRLRGWEPVAQRLVALAQAKSATIILTDERKIAAQLVYQLRDTVLRARIWSDPSGPPGNHFELALPLAAAEVGQGAVLYVTRWPDDTGIVAHFAESRALTTLQLQERHDEAEALHVLRLSGPLFR